MRTLFCFIVLFWIGISLNACKESTPKQQTTSAAAHIKTAYAVNEIVVVMEKDLWENDTIGKTIRAALNASFQGLTLHEPTFDIIYATPQTFEQQHKKANSILWVADLSQKNEASQQAAAIKNTPNTLIRDFMTIKSNLYADPQQIIYIYGEQKDSLLNNLLRYHRDVVAMLNVVEDKKALSVEISGGEDKEKQDRIGNKYNIYINLPKGYQPAAEQGNAGWYRRELANGEVDNYLLYTASKKSGAAFTLKQALAVRDTLGKRLVKSETEGSYMRSDTTKRFFVTPLQISGRNALEVRGQWEMTRESTAGPFVNYIIDDGERIVVLDAFLFVPDLKKRDRVRQIESVLRAAKL